MLNGEISWMEAREKVRKPGGCSARQQIWKGWHSKETSVFQSRKCHGPYEERQWNHQLLRAPISSWPLATLTRLIYLLPITLLSTPVLQMVTQRLKMTCPLFHLIIGGINRI